MWSTDMYKIPLLTNTLALPNPYFLKMYKSKTQHNSCF